MPSLSLYKLTPSTIHHHFHLSLTEKPEMGNCASPQYATNCAFTFTLHSQSTVKIVHTDGSLQEFKQPIKANLVLSQNPNCFLCNSESMYVNSHLPHVADDEELQLGQIYFLVPLSKSHALLSLQELCSFAIKASSALAHQTPDIHPQKYGRFSMEMVRDIENSDWV